MAVNFLTMALMPLSQAASWMLILKQRPSLFAAVWKVALFYCIWALYNKYFAGNDSELGQYSMGMLAIAAFLQHREFSMCGNVVVLLNYCVAFYIAFSRSIHELAIDAKGSDNLSAITWAYIFRVYVLSNLAMWSMVLLKFIKLPSHTVPSSREASQSLLETPVNAGYQPVENVQA